MFIIYHSNFDKNILKMKNVIIFYNFLKVLLINVELHVLRLVKTELYDGTEHMRKSLG